LRGEREARTGLCSTTGAAAVRARSARNWGAEDFNVESRVVGGSSVLRVNARTIPGLGKDGINNRDFTTGTKERPSVARGEIYTIAADFLK